MAITDLGWLYVEQPLNIRLAQDTGCKLRWFPSEDVLVLGLHPWRVVKEFAQRLKNGQIAKKQLRQLSPLQPRASVVQPEKLNHGFDVPLAANVVGDPPGLGVVVMQVCSACSNQFFTDPNGKREIRESVAVQMPDLAMSHMEEDQASNMRRDSNSGPRGYFTLNLRGNRLARH